MRPILLPRSSVNQKLPSDPLTIATGRLFGVWIGNSRREPVEGGALPLVASVRALERTRERLKEREMIRIRLSTMRGILLRRNVVRQGTWSEPKKTWICPGKNW